MRYTINNKQDLDIYITDNRDKMPFNDIVELETLKNMPDLVCHYYATKIIKKYYQEKYNIRLTNNFFYMD